MELIVPIIAISSKEVATGSESVTGKFGVHSRPVTLPLLFSKMTDFPSKERNSKGLPVRVTTTLSVAVSEKDRRSKEELG